MAHDDSSRDDGNGRLVHTQEVGASSTSGIHSIEVGELSLQETMILYRRRLGISQTQMAALFRVHRETYGRLERGDNIQLKIDRPYLGELQDHEKCLILRRRSGWTQEQCAESMNITRYWFNLMELGKAPCEPLTKFWGHDAG